MKPPRNPVRADPPTAGSEKGNFWRSTASTLIGVLVGGFITLAASYSTAYLTADNQRKQFLIERTQSFAEFMALKYLPLSGDVPQDCQTRLQECRQLRQSAFQIYLFLPSNAQKDLVKSFGPDAVKATSSASFTRLPLEVAAIDDALKDVREWVTGKTESEFNFILPCADWKVEEKQCHKQ